MCVCVVTDVSSDVEAGWVCVVTDMSLGVEEEHSGRVARDLWVSVEDLGDVYKDTRLSVMCFFFPPDQRPSDHHGCGAGVRHPAKHHRKAAF